MMVRGVQILHSSDDLESLIDGPYLLEEMVSIHKELAVIAVANQNNEVQSFPAVEMIFDPAANLVDSLMCPAQIDPSIESAAKDIAENLINSFGISGLLSVEFFLTTDNELLINEVAPRPHNSGHHTIEACNHSQYEMHLRGVLNWPLPAIKLLKPALMINLLGSGNPGPTEVHGWDEVMNLSDVYVHLYGKKESRPYRKMGHITIMGEDMEQILKKAKIVKEHLTITGAK